MSISLGGSGLGVGSLAAALTQTFAGAEGGAAMGGGTLPSDDGSGQSVVPVHGLNVPIMPGQVRLGVVSHASKSSCGSEGEGCRGNERGHVL